METIQREEIRNATGARKIPPPPRKYRGRHRVEHKRSFFKELPIILVVAFLVAFLLKTFALQAFYIPSASMEPTLYEGHRVLVEKVTYRFGDLERGDVVVFERDVVPDIPEEELSAWTRITDSVKGLFGFPTRGHQDFIKRVIAVGGDEVQGIDGVVKVNGQPVDEPYLVPGTETSQFGPTVVPDGMIFVMGDNRGNSDDSRSFGPVPVDKVIGRGWILLWPVSEFSTL